MAAIICLVLGSFLAKTPSMAVPASNVEGEAAVADVTETNETS